MFIIKIKSHRSLKQNIHVKQNSKDIHISNTRHIKHSMKSEDRCCT